MAGSEVKADLWINEYITPWDIYAHGITKILDYKKTAYQEMYIVETGAYGKGLVLDGKWQSCTGDEFIYHEALVHPAAIAHKQPKNVLVLGGGEGATIREVLRWNSVAKVMMVDIDGEVVESCRKYLPEMHQNAFEDPRVELVIADALKVLEKTQIKWDIIISDLSDPIEEGPSFQLFTKEYFTRLEKVLNSDGYVVIQAGPVSPVDITLHARLVNTLKAVFANVISYTAYTPSYPAPWGFALATKQDIITRPDPEAIDRILLENTKSGFRFIDGITLLGLLQTPKYIREAIAAETEVYTLEKPPKFFGKGASF